MMKLRVWHTPMFSRDGSALPTTVKLEWAGRVGHASSYGLLGGHRASAGDAGIGHLRDVAFDGSLAGRCDHVRHGLPDDYRSTVVDVVCASPIPVRISAAAHGEIGSSQLVFRTLAHLLCRLLATGVPADDEVVWSFWDQCRDEARRGAARHSDQHTALEQFD